MTALKIFQKWLQCCPEWVLSGSRIRTPCMDAATRDNQWPQKYFPISRTACNHRIINIDKRYYITRSLVPTGLVISSNLITPHNAIASTGSVGAPWLDESDTAPLAAALCHCVIHERLASACVSLPRFVTSDAGSSNRNRLYGEKGGSVKIYIIIKSPQSWFNGV